MFFLVVFWEFIGFFCVVLFVFFFWGGFFFFRGEDHFIDVLQGF